MSNNEETGPSDQDADEMDYEGEQEYLDYLTASWLEGPVSSLFDMFPMIKSPRLFLKV